MKKVKLAMKSKKLAVGIALALGCSLMSIASAANYDMTSSENAGGITWSHAVNGDQIGKDYRNPDTYTFGYDKTTGQVLGGDITMAADMRYEVPNSWGGTQVKGVSVYANLDVKASDLPDCSLDTVKKVNAAVLKKLKPAEGLVHYYGFDYISIRILDDDGNVVRVSKVKFADDMSSSSVLSGGTYKTVLSNDSNNKEYDIKQEDTQQGYATIPANTWYVGDTDSRYGLTVAPDLSKETVKAAVRGAEKDLYVTNVLGSSTWNSEITIKAEGKNTDKVYGVYNDKKGLVHLKDAKMTITAEGNEQSNGAYAGNDADYTSKIILESTADANTGVVLKANGNVVEAGKNGEISLEAYKSSLETAAGNLLYAHDGGVINVGHFKKGTAGLVTTMGDSSKYLALAEKGGIINIGVLVEHLDSVDYDKSTVLKGSGDISGNMKADDDSKVNFGLSGKYKYTGDAEGNVNLYLKSGASWEGSAIGDNASLDLGSDSLWNITSSSAQHLKVHNGADSSSKRSFVNVGEGSLTIDKYSGNTTFVYQHDATDASKILGGDLTIKSAVPVKNLSVGVGSKEYSVTETPSTVYLQTSVDGIDTTDEAVVNSVLDNLAKKLTYSAYVDGERNLSGRVEIAEGLTSSSVSKYYSNITFDAANGQAKKEDVIYKPYTGVIFGNEAADAKAGYQDVISGTAADKNLKYTFNDDTLIEVKLNKDPRSFGWGGLYCAAINNYGNRPYQSSPANTKGGPSYTLDMQGHDLNINFSAFPTPATTSSQPMWTAAAIGAYRDGTITIDNPGAVSIKSTNNYYYGSAIRASTAAAGETGAHVVINNDNSKEHAVKIRGGIDTPGYQLNWRAIEVTTQNGTTAENGNSVDIKGLVDIEVSKCASLFARGNYATIDIGGGRIVSHNHSSIWTVGNKALINLNMQKDAEGNVIDAGNNYLQIEGDVSTATPFYGSNGTINVGLNTADSYLKGHFYGAGNNNLYLRNGAVWDNMPAVTHNWAGGSYSTNNIVSNLSNLYGGVDSAHAGNIYQHESEELRIQNLTGYVNAYLGHEIGEDGKANFDALGNIVVEKATQTDGKNANITLFTDRNGIDTSENDEVVNTLTALAKKLVYNEAIDSPEVDTKTSAMDGSKPVINLDGKVGIAEGLTAGSVAIRLADLDFSKENGEGKLIESTIHTPEAYVPKLYGDKETAMMRGAKSAMASSAMMWRAESNDLMKRMGDLRMSEGEKGLWAKYYGGKYEMDSQKTNFNLKYNAYQLGYDVEAGNGWTVGAAVSYNDGSATYGSGRGDLSTYSAGIYGTWKSEDGQYVDIIAKYSKLDNEFKVFNDSGHKLNGDYKTWGTSISAEYGKRFEKENGFYFDPSVELTLGHINGKDYNAHSDFMTSVGVMKDLQVEQDSFNTLVGRVGFRLGQKLDNASYFVKLAAAHEFSGDFDTTYRAVGEPEGRTSIDFGDTWYEAQIGGTVKLSDNSVIYADFERSFGGDVEEKWRVDAGLRWSF
ncbi:autotransporter outer membrane beta-barrel domain-containing protein [Phascolarctobacterium sp.]